MSSTVRHQSYSDRDGYIWLDGKMIPWREANVHILSHAMHYASSVFEGLRAYNGRIFRLHDHSIRMVQSARIMDLSYGDGHASEPMDANKLDDVCKQVLEANGLQDGYIRPVSWRGAEEMGIASRGALTHTAVAAWPWGSYFAADLRLARAKYHRPPPNSSPWQAKAASLYAICTLSKHAAMDQGYGDALMLDHEGNVAEATGANIFFLQGQTLHTPIPDSFLNGITRQTVIQLCKDRGCEVVERKIAPSELHSFDDCFVTGTAAEVSPVKAIQSSTGSASDITYSPSELVANIKQDYHDLVRGDA